MTHYTYDSARRPRMAIGALLLVVAALAQSDAPAAWSAFDLYLWPDGRVPYRFADAADTDWWGAPAVPVPGPGAGSLQEKWRDEMDNWEATMRIPDPADAGQTRPYVRFEPCAGRCEDEGNYVLIRMNAKNADSTLSETNNMCSWRGVDHKDQPGRHPVKGGVTVLHVAPGQDANTLRHELGHCLGLWHEFGRPDRDFWLDEQPKDVDGTVDWKTTYGTAGVGAGEMPELGNYDYDSIMHYGSVKDDDGECITFWLDLRGNTFNRRGLDAAPQNSKPCRKFPTGAGGSVDDQVSARDRSRVLQYYAREAYPNWGFFESINTRPGLYDYDGRPDPYLAPGVSALVPGVSAVGTPAVVFHSAGNHDVFVRGSNERLYRKSFRRTWLPFEPEPVDTASAWTSLGCCFGSDPSAISRGNGQIDVVAIGASTGRPLRNRLVNEAWQGWVYVTAGVPTGGLRQTPDGGYIGPAITSRAADSLDVFVVRTDGRLAATSLVAGVWQAWQTLSEPDTGKLLGLHYEVTARPAAVAVSATAVRLAINEREVHLYEPRVTFKWPNAPVFELGTRTADMARLAPPALTTRSDASSPYRVLIATSGNRIAHKFAGGRFRDIGGIPAPGTGVSAVATGAYSALIVMNGEDMTGCVRTCLSGQPDPGGVIQPGGLWLREFR